MRRFIFGLLLGFATLVAVPTAQTCPFCTSSGTTLAQEAKSASLILFGTPQNAQLNLPGFPQGSTDLKIDLVIKPHPIVAGKTVVTLPRYLAQDPKQPQKYLVFCDVFRGELDPYRGMPFKKDSRIAPYLKGALELKDKDIATRLKFFFDYLDDADVEIANDAYTEFGNADYKDFREVGKKFPADRVVRWLSDPGTPPSRLGLYGSMLGHCGKPADVAALRALIDDPKRRYAAGLDGVFAGFIMLDPNDGWAKLGDTLTNAKTDFIVRYASMRACAFLWENRPDLIGRGNIAEKVAETLPQADIADLAIEDLRKWSYWKAADRVVGVLKLEQHDTELIRRSVLRYCLQCPAKESPAAAAFVEEMRKANSKRVEEAESLLSSEVLPITVGK